MLKMNGTYINSIFFSNLLSDESICNKTESTPCWQTIKKTVLSHGFCILAWLEAWYEGCHKAHATLAEAIEDTMLKVNHLSSRVAMQKARDKMYVLYKSIYAAANFSFS